MPIPVKEIKLLDLSLCFAVRDSTGAKAKCLLFLEKNIGNSYTMKEITIELNKNSTNIEGNSLKKSNVYAQLAVLCKAKKSPIQKKGSYYWYEQK